MFMKIVHKLLPLGHVGYTIGKLTSSRFAQEVFIFAQEGIYAAFHTAISQLSAGRSHQPILALDHPTYIATRRRVNRGCQTNKAPIETKGLTQREYYVMFYSVRCIYMHIKDI